MARRQADGQSVHWASDSSPTTVQDMGVNHCGAHKVCLTPISKKRWWSLPSRYRSLRANPLVIMW